MNTSFLPMRTGYSPPPFVRTNLPTVSGDYALLETDLGVIMTTPSTCQVFAYSPSQFGKEYTIGNQSDGDVTILPANGEFIVQKRQSFSSVTIPSGESRQIKRESTNTNLVIL